MSLSPYVADVTQRDFPELVLKKSHEVPVLVDFWAEWCGPCQMLAPILLRLAEGYQGKFFLAKVDTESEQGLAMQYGIRGIPNVKIFRNGQVVDEFVGLQSETTLRTVLDRHVPRESDAAVDRALAAQRAGDADQAVALLQDAMAQDPANDRVKAALARLLFEQSRFDEGEQVLKGLSYDGRADPEIQRLMARLAFLRAAAAAPPAPELERALAADPGNLEARHQLAARRVLAEDYEGALQQLLEIVARDRRFGDDAGRKGMLTVFNLLGGKGELVTRYRGLLSRALN